VRRRAFLALLCGAAALGAAADATAQARGAPPRVGVLAPEAADRPHPETDALVEGLRALGYVDGKTVALVMRWAGGEDALPRLAAELAALEVAVIVAPAPPAARAAAAATRTIPIVMRATTDPVSAGFTASLARPSRNITGVSSVSAALYPKRLELLKELVPGLAQVVVLWNPQGTGGPDRRHDLAQVQAAATLLGLTLRPITVEHGDDIAPALAAAVQAGAQALLPLRDPTIVGNDRRIAELARDSRLPAIYDDRAFVETGGLASYGPNLAALHRRLAVYVDRILKGARPADLPIEQPTEFELVINQRTATAMGFTVPPALLARADAVIE
jgi:putative ABC transport system substrate-binding protein